MTQKSSRRGHRLSKIVTKLGDRGMTQIQGKRALPKDHPRIEAIGLVDELNALLGVAITSLDDEIARLNDQPNEQEKMQKIRHEWIALQHLLFNIGGELAMPEISLISAESLKRIESLIENYNESLPPLKEFILPGGTKVVAQCHLLRAFTRKVERTLWRLEREEALNPTTLCFLNRLSDYFFIVARRLAKLNNTDERLWERSCQL